MPLLLLKWIFRIIINLTILTLFRYKQKFGFPFIICARENKVESIIRGLQDRYQNSHDQEVNIGIEEVKKICKLRILDIAKDD